MLHEDGVNALLGCKYPQCIGAQDARAVVCHYPPKTLLESLPLSPCLAESTCHRYDEGNLAPAAGFGGFNRPFGASSDDRKVDIRRQVLDVLEHRLSEDGILCGVGRVYGPLRAKQGLEDYTANVCHSGRGTYYRHSTGSEETL